MRLRRPSPDDGLAVVASALIASAPLAVSGDQATQGGEPHRSPIALALSADGTRLLTANQTSGSVSLVDTGGGPGARTRSPTGDKPGGRGALARRPARGGHATGTATTSPSSTSAPTGSRSPAGSRSAPSRAGSRSRRDGKTAYVAVGVSNEVVRVDLDARKVTGRLAVGREPRGLALSPDGSRLLVGNARSQDLSRDRDRALAGRADRCRSRGTTSGRWPSPPTARRATSPT